MTCTKAVATVVVLKLKLSSVCNIFFFNVLMNYSATVHFSSLCVKYMTHVLFGGQPVLFPVFWNALVSHFIYFEGSNKAYLIKASITHKEKRTSFFYLLNNCVSAESAAHMLSTEDKKNRVLKI